MSGRTIAGAAGAGDLVSGALDAKIVRLLLSFFLFLLFLQLFILFLLLPAELQLLLIGQLFELVLVVVVVVLRGR